MPRGSTRALRNREQFGTNIGVLAPVIATTSWQDLTAADFNRWNTAALNTTSTFSHVVVENASAQILYVLGRTGGTVAVAKAWPIAAGASFNFDIFGVNAGACVATISLQGSAAATTTNVFAAFIAP